MGDKQTVKAARIFICVAVSTAVLLAVSLPVAADTYGGGSVAGYGADKPIDIGRIVQLTGEKSANVTLSTQANIQNMFGVTVDRNQVPLTISNEGLSNEVFVAVSGTYSVLVSTQAGPIAAGDYVTLSSIDGVAMRTGDQEVTVFGRANESFDGKGTILGTQALQDAEGGTKTVQLGTVPVTIDIKNNPNHKSTTANVPELLQRVGTAIAEKEVSPVRIYLSLGITIVSLIAAIAVVYAGVRNSVISIGRNPMSRRSIFRALIGVILTGLLILIIGLFAVYLLLKL